MEKSDIDKLRGYAAASRSQVSFAGATIIRWDYKNGKWLAGKSGTDMTAREAVADVPDAMGGFQRLESGKKPLYALTRILDAAIEPIERSELSDADPSKWLDKDPWMPVTVMPFFDPETRQVFVIAGVFGVRDALSNLIDALLDHIAAHPEAAAQLPLVRLGVREYVKSDGATGVERPASVLHIKPPTLTVTPVESDKASNGKTMSADSPKAKSPKRKISLSGEAEFDDTIPF